jgi:hypothetical protein
MNELFHGSLLVCGETPTLNVGQAPDPAAENRRFHRILCRTRDWRLPDSVGTAGAAGKFEQAELMARCAGCPVCRPFAEPAFERLDFDSGHDAPLCAGGSATLSVTDDCQARGGDGTIMEPWAPWCCAILLIRPESFWRAFRA